MPADPPPYNMHPSEMIDWVLDVKTRAEERVRLFAVIRVLAEKVMCLEAASEAEAERRHQARLKEAMETQPEAAGLGLGQEQR